MTVEFRLRKTFLLVIIGVDVPVGVSGAARAPGVAGREAVNGVEGFVVDVAAPMSWTLWRAVKISSSVKRLNGSRLLRIVPVKSVGS